MKYSIKTTKTLNADNNLKFPLIIDRARKKDISYGWLIKKHNIKYDITIYDDYIE